ncbi:MAG TPA: hypothetical protein VE596_09870 [Gaiellaceae bacterium]|jgi:hypothetical protein|nr:hypothetical protein [Gaiellaceae bacterium]
MYRVLLFAVAAVFVGAIAAALLLQSPSRDRPSARPPVVRAALVARRNDARTSPEGDGQLSPALEQALRLDPASVRTLGVYAAARGGRFQVSYGRRPGGVECLVAVGYGGAGSSCGGLFALGPVAILETAGGGPAPRERSDLEVVGLARPNVARVAVVDLQGHTRWPVLNANHAFLLEFDAAEFHAGAGPAELVAYDSSGAEIMRLDLSEPT